MSSEGQPTIRLAPPGQQWEYRVATINIEQLFGTNVDVNELGAYLNEKGADGWELVAVAPIQRGHGYTSELLMVMKRLR